MSLKWVVVLFLCSVCWAHGLDDTKWDPLMVITFPLDNQDETVLGHTVIRYTLYPSGYATNEKNIYGKGSISSDSDWLSQSHVDAVLKLVAEVSASKAKPKAPIDAIFMQGTATNNKKVSRDYSQNRAYIRAMLRLLGGVRGDLKEHLK